MAQEVGRELIAALTSFSVGTLDGHDVMMVLEYARSADELVSGPRFGLPLAMTPDRAQQLGEALVLAAKAARLGNAPNDTLN